MLGVQHAFLAAGISISAAAPDGVTYCESSGIDEAGTVRVTALIDAVRGAGLSEAAEMFSTVYWAWLRTMGAYRFGLPYVSRPEEGMTPYSALHVVNYTIQIWAPQIPGSPIIDNEKVREEAADDEAWHREEDRRMRRAAGEEI